VRLLALAASALALSGCATLQPRLGWYCNAQATAGSIRAQSFRFLDHTGKLLKIRTEWFYTPANDSVDARAEWIAGTPTRGYRTATVVIRHYTLPPAERGQLLVYSDRGTIAAPTVQTSIRSIHLNGSQLMALRGADTAFGIHTYNPRGELMGGSGIEWSVFDEALAMAQRLDNRTLVMSAHFRRHCDREQWMVLI